MKEINRNFPWCDEHTDLSFSGILHEEYIWSDEEYLKLDNELYTLAKEYNHSNTIPRELVWRCMRIFSLIMLYIGCHFDDNDSYRITNLTNDELYLRRERLQLVFEGFFQGKMPNKKYLE